MTSACAGPPSPRCRAATTNSSGRTPCEKLSLREAGRPRRRARRRRSPRPPARTSASSPTRRPATAATNWTTTGAPGIPRQLGGSRRRLARPGGWEGMTRVGGVDLPGDVCAHGRADRGGHPRLGHRAVHRTGLRGRRRRGRGGARTHVASFAADGPGRGAVRSRRRRSGRCARRSSAHWRSADATPGGGSSRHTGSHGPRRRAARNRLLQGPGPRGLAPRDGLPQCRGHRRATRRRPAGEARQGQQLAVAAGDRPEDRQGHRSGVVGPGTRHARRTTLGGNRSGWRRDPRSAQG